MFIQVIEGRTSDPEAVHRRLEVWERELMPGAIGYLGSTGGCTDDGSCILIARFESTDAAQANSDRPEQSAWWEETAKCFDGPVRFHDTEHVMVMDHGDMSSARFVQVMEGHVADRERAERMERESDQFLATARPDLLGSITAYFDGDEFCEVAYFTSEEEARRMEQQMPDGDAADMFQEFQEVMRVDQYLDIRQPWMTTA